MAFTIVMIIPLKCMNSYCGGWRIDEGDQDTVAAIPTCTHMRGSSHPVVAVAVAEMTNSPIVVRPNDL